MSEPIVVVAVFTPREGAFDRVRDVLAKAIAGVHAEEGCLLYAIHSDPEGRIIMIEKWASEELLNAHGDSPAVRQLTAGVEGLLTHPAVVTRLIPIPAGTRDQGQL